MATLNEAIFKAVQMLSVNLTCITCTLTKNTKYYVIIMDRDIITFFFYQLSKQNVTN